MMKNKEILILANDVVSRGDYEGFMAYCTDDVTWTFLGETKISGKSQVLAYMKKEYLAPPVFDVELLISEGDYVMAKGSIQLMGEDKKYKQYNYCDIWKFKDGKMAELQAFVIAE